MKLKKCKKCGSKDIKLYDCGYSSFNCGGGECRGCGNKVSVSTLGCNPTQEELAAIWNSGQQPTSEEKLATQIKRLKKKLETRPSVEIQRYYHHFGGEFVFGAPVKIGMTLCEESKCIGRLLQVRRKKGQFGTDIFLIRRRDGSICHFENASIEHYRSELPPLDPKVDKIGVEYFDAQHYGEVGFLIEKPKQEDAPPAMFGMIITKG